MRRIIVVFLALMLLSGSVIAQQPDSTSYSAPEKSSQPGSPSGPSRIFYGGSIGLSFGSYTRIAVTPMIGYRLAKMWSVGCKVAYEYVKDTRGTLDLTSNNYGGSLFARFRPHRQLYLHGEYAYMSYKWESDIASSDRDWVPFLLLGGGFVQPISNRSSAFVEVLFDVLQDDGSPYDDWEPWISIGVTAGF